ncbi:uncharacterized protein N7515_002281 [Penicillium bovifimosum]|uniref:Retrotransposon gag domain-containing protein n=1 Tax=Penicillium bovifimosum TaxID=126998 RepID=A0A9W9HBL7_9EURO|nr:uncharacterized protein N7515_002281 [Penicillium bovifimosum]KAJ5143494.1 hypothetical protein N7515_002281 [Penicillium bovifimosum]
MATEKSSPILFLNLFSAPTHGDTTRPSRRCCTHYAASYLRGPAKKWFTPHLDEITGSCDFSTFEDLNPYAVIEGCLRRPRSGSHRKLRSLRQGNDSVATYYSKFISLVSILDWNDKAKRSQFRTGLKDDVKRLLIGRSSPHSFEDFVMV